MSTWRQEIFRARMRRFDEQCPPQPGEVPVSIKVRVRPGCFHREHSPRGYALIDEQISTSSRSQPRFVFEEHESGPELLVYVALATGGVTLAKSIIDLVTSIIKARSEGIAGGDRPSDPIELVVRRTSDDGEYREEVVLRFGPRDSANGELIGRCLRQALEKLIAPNTDKQATPLPAPQVQNDRKRSSRTGS